MSVSHILAPIDGTDPSFRALEFAVELAERFEADLDVVHITDEESEASAEILSRAETVLEAGGMDVTPEVSTDMDLDFRPADAIGEDILELVESRGYDHVVMGHQGSGTVERAIIGSAAETVLRAERVPATVVP
ncbi:MAG: universal stress protein [Halodesulfurarchaeum sp.]